MKRLLCVMMLCCLSATVAFAVGNERSVLEIRLNDHSPIVVSIDGRNYDKHGRNITIADIPRGWHTLRVYEYLEYKDGGGRAKLLYSGRLRIDKGTVTRCTIDRETRRMRIHTMNTEDAYIQYDRPENRDTDAAESQVLSDNLQDLQEVIEEKVTDTERLKLMKESLAGNSYSTAELRVMLGWLAFEGSKLDFAKWSYKQVQDKEEYPKLEDVFLISANKDSFNNFIKAQ